MFARVLVAVLMGIVAAILLVVITGLLVGAGTSGGQIGVWVGLVGFVLFILLWARNSLSTRVTFRRSLLTVAVECFGLPLAGIVYTLVYAGSRTSSTAETAGALIGGGAVTTVLGCVGLALGVFCLVLYLALRAEPQARPAPQA